MPVDIEGPQIIGLRSGGLPVAVDSVRIVGPDGQTVLHESFRNCRHYWTTMFIAAATGLFPTLLAVPFLMRRPGVRAEPAAYRWLLTLGVAVIVLSLLFALDYFVWSRRYFSEVYLVGGKVEPHRVAIQLESLRNWMFLPKTHGMDSVKRFPIKNEIRRSISRWDGAEEIPRDLIARYSPSHSMVPESLGTESFLQLPAKTASTIRVAFVGTSQTWGAGAERISDTFVARTHALLASALENTSLETYNLAIQGSTSRELLDRYTSTWRLVRPDLLVINLGFNDYTEGILTENLEALVREARATGGSVVFVIEAHSTELQRMPDRALAMQKLGAKLDVPVWDLHGYLASEGVYDSGNIWWDCVHMTSYAQNLTARWLAERMLPLLQSRSPAAGS
jgi:lysophospholipase L1-like esterase